MKCFSREVVRIGKRAEGGQRLGSGWGAWVAVGFLLVAVGVGTGCSDDSGAGEGDAGGGEEDAALYDGGAGDAQVGDAQTGDGGGEDCTELMVESDVAIPMRDGKSLSAFIQRPANPQCQVPTVLIQTPYDKNNSRALWFDGDAQANPLFSSPEFAFVVLDWRGFYGSSGAAVSQPNYGVDGYDAVEWIAGQPWSDGQVATWGVSALCRVQYWTAVEKPPHLAAGVPIFCSINNTYHEYYPGGVIRREYVDTLGMLFGGSVVEDHPLEDVAWAYIQGLYDTADVEVPMLVVAGWFDLDAGASLETFNGLQEGSPQSVAEAHRALVGPWHHFASGGESGGGASSHLTGARLRGPRAPDSDATASPGSTTMRGTGRWGEPLGPGALSGHLRNERRAGRQADAGPQPGSTPATFYLQADGWPWMPAAGPGPEPA